ncbi:hypothetical protein BN946_scf184801.g11 [Trametes cinnabarina]|uniref:Uncharacterized protein n=1 Tax=Pycnoporus cinnabarinus TaxID=5643 RepID=A0A060S918_PYCCI|nr:hypothetical protein BN946_scf184801.g11 [Trametes cinnabarina]
MVGQYFSAVTSKASEMTQDPEDGLLGLGFTALSSMMQLHLYSGPVEYHDIMTDEGYRKLVAEARCSTAAPSRRTSRRSSTSGATFIAAEPSIVDKAASIAASASGYAEESGCYTFPRASVPEVSFNWERQDLDRQRRGTESGGCVRGPQMSNSVLLVGDRSAISPLTARSTAPFQSRKGLLPTTPSVTGFVGSPVTTTIRKVPTFTMDRASSSGSSTDSPPHGMGLEDDILTDAMPESVAPAWGPGRVQDYYNTMSNLKRPLPSRLSAHGPLEGAREQKARKKDIRAGGGSAGGPSVWEQGSIQATGGGRSQREERELVDQALVDQLRNQFGDPFDESVVKRAAGTST